jgi:hypothetical protein
MSRENSVLSENQLGTNYQPRTCLSPTLPSTEKKTAFNFDQKYNLFLEYLEDYIAQFKDWNDEILFKGYCDVATPKVKTKVKYRKKIVVVTKYRFLIFKKNALTHRTTVRWHLGFFSRSRGDLKRGHISLQKFSLLISVVDCSFPKTITY